MAVTAHRPLRRLRCRLSSVRLQRGRVPRIRWDRGGPGGQTPAVTSPTERDAHLGSLYAALSGGRFCHTEIK